jgi:DNA-binding response OmpR family regulator
MARILVVEDEDKLRKALTKGLTEQGYDVTAVEDGRAGLERAVGEPFDCLILDMMLPGCDGLEIVRTLRAAGDQTPTLMLTARGAIEDRVLGLDSGADDYLSKPFSWDELLARIRVCLRRHVAVDSPVMRCGELALDCARRILSRGDRQVQLTIRQCELLEYLIRNRGRDVGRDDLARDVWREPIAGLTNVIEVYVSYLRKKLATLEDPTVIRTIRGVGYRLETP